MNQQRRSIGCIAIAVVGNALLIGLAIFLTQVVFEGMDANLMRFESEPAEGMDYWRKAELQKGMPGLVVLWGSTACIAIFVLWLLLKNRK